MLKRNCRGVAVLLAAVALLGEAASAATQTGTLAVQARVASACTVGTATLDFGTYVAGSTTLVDAPGTISYTGCYSSTVTIELDLGLNAASAKRNMKQGTSLLNYEIYQDSGRKTVFATGADAKSITTDATGAGSVPIYGRIFKSQGVAPGTYTDTVGIVLTF